MNATTSPRQQVTDLPLRFGDHEDFKLVRAALRTPGFDEATVYQALGRAGFSLEDDVASLQTTENGAAEFGPLVALLVEQKQVPRVKLDHLLDRQTLTAFLNLDLIRVSDDDSSRYYAPVVVYPIDGLLIASDYYKPPFEGWTPPGDSVYPALHSTPLLRVLPRSQVGDVLDLCSGTGIFGLALSRHARTVVAADITERAMHFASFNRFLNSCDNVHTVQGDLYAPVAGHTFDRIVAHPPYMPTFTETTDVQTWRDGGLSGEEIVTRIFQSLPQYLRPGGDFYSVFAAAESNALRLEQRARSWLGEAERDFDLIFACKRHFSTSEVARLVVKRSAGAVDIDPQQIEEYLRMAGFTHYAFGVLGVRRRNHRAAPWTFRTELSEQSNELSFPYTFNRNSLNSQPLLKNKQLRPALSSDLLVKELHHVESGKLRRTELLLECEWPFHHAVKTETWIRPLIDRFTGRASIEQIFTEASLTQILPAGLTLAQFVEIVQALLDRGYLIVSESA